MLQFMWGALAMANVTAGLFFLRFWAQTKDRLFALFAAAFLVFSLNWIILVSIDPSKETRHYVYFVRLVAFALILAAVGFAFLPA